MTESKVKKKKRRMKQLLTSDAASVPSAFTIPSPEQASLL